jgi:hypothetical protein
MPIHDSYTKRFFDLLSSPDAPTRRPSGENRAIAEYLANALKHDLYLVDHCIAIVDPSQAEYAGECPVCCADVTEESEETHGDNCPLAEVIISRGGDPKSPGGLIDIDSPLSTFMPKGTRVSIHGRTREPGKGLSYGAISDAVLLDDCNGSGWDVVDVQTSDGPVSVYSFDVSRKARAS